MKERLEINEKDGIEQRNFEEYDNLYYYPFEEKSFEVLTKTKIFKKIIHKNRISLHHKKILEVGFGSGNLISTIINNGGLYYGLEMSSSSITKCRKKYGSLVITDFIVHNQINYGCEFDIIIMSHSLEHIKYEDKILEEAIRVLKKGGVIIIGVPSIQSCSHLHYRHYTREDSKRIANTYNLRLCYIEEIKSVKIISLFLEKLKSKKMVSKKMQVNRIGFLKWTYYMCISPILSEIYSRNIGRGEINELWYIFEKV